MTETEAAWLAGLIEGEGSFVIDKKNRPNASGRPVVHIAIEMCDEDVVAKAAKLMGTSYSHRKSRNGWSPTWLTRAYGKKAESIMRDIRPYMGSRRTARIDELLKMNLSHHARERKTA